MKASNVVRNVIYILGLVYKYTPGYFIWSIVYNLFRGFSLAAANVIFLKILFNELEKGTSYRYIVFIIILYVIYQIGISWLYSWFWHYYSAKSNQILHGRMHADLISKVIQMDLINYDKSDFYTDYIWALEGSDARVNQTLNDFGGILNQLASLLTIIGVLLTIDPSVILLLVASIALSSIIQYFFSEKEVKRALDLKPLEKKEKYINRIFYLKEYAAELRLSNVSEMLVNDYQKVIEDTKKTYRNYGKSLFKLASIRTMSSVLLSEAGIAMLLVYKMFVKASISMGDFVVSLNSIWRINENIRMIIEHLGRFPEHSINAEKIQKFMNYQPSIKSSKDCIQVSNNIVNELELKNVSFTYEGQSQPTIKNLSLKIRKNEKIALVGYNGAGKSTLIKLLLRLYDVMDGEILLNSTNIKKLDLQQFRQSIGCVFQDHQIYAVQLAENVVMDNATEKDQGRIIKALHDAGFESKLNKMENGIWTNLMREYDEAGVNLSGGEVQKVAISRIFVKNYPIVILDEPTSALDPIAESRLNQVIIDKLKDSIVLLISHRLSTTRMADRILLLDQGEIVEEGTHEELMKLDGKYAEMFNLQAKKYRFEQVQGFSIQPKTL
ncbi:putative multidrug export ATP-binding/permease protein [compost metagenome]